MKTSWNRVALKTLAVKVLQGRFGAQFLALLLILFAQMGCRSSSEYRLEADKVANEIIQKKMQAIGRSGQFNIERPSNILRRRLLTEQNLPYDGPSSLGTDKLEPISHWPEEDYPRAELSLDPLMILEESNGSLQLSLMRA